MYYNHILFAFELLLFYLVFVCGASLTWLVNNFMALMIFSMGLILGSIIPDADHSESYVSKQYPLLSKIFRLFLALLAIVLYPITKLFNKKTTLKKLRSHRGLGHSLIIPGALILALAWIGTNQQIPGMLTLFLAGLSFGYLAHIMGDLLTTQGVPLLLPLSTKRYSLRLFSTGSKREHAFVQIVLILEIFAMVGDWNLIVSKLTLMQSKRSLEILAGKGFYSKLLMV